MVIGITGPTGSGKTTALDALKKLGFHVIDCDALYDQLLDSDEELRRGLKNNFGNVFLDNGKLDRKTLGNRVFGNPKELSRLNQVIFPIMNRAVQEKIDNNSQKGVAIDAINLVESGLGEKCDLTIAFIADPAVRMKRIMERDGIDEERARARIAAQKPDSFYRKNCVFTLENRAGSRKEFEHLVYEFFSELIQDMEV